MTDTIEAVALKALIERARNHKMTPQERFDQMVSFVSEGVDKAAVRARLIENATVPQEIIDAAIATDRKALIEGAGELEQRLLDHAHMIQRDGLGAMLETATQAAATIAAMKAEIERLTEREAQAKLDGVRAGIEAAFLEVDGMGTRRFTRDMIAMLALAGKSIRALDAAAIAKGEE